MNPFDSLAQAYAEELPWLAFLYVSEELTPDEVVDFEERLLTDQAAREAVADAMKLADGVWLASAMDSYRPKSAPCPAPVVGTEPEGRRWNRWAVWVSTTAIAAGLAFSVGRWLAGQAEAPDAIAKPSDSKPAQIAENIASQPVEGAEELVGLWSDSQNLLAVLGPEAEYPAELGEEYHSLERADSEDEAFSWMLAAVSAAGEMPKADPEVMEN